MTRKRAIEEAMKRILASAGEAREVDIDGAVQKVAVPSMFDIHEELEAMWTEGRVAGLREAARMCVPLGNLDTAQADITRKANRLAKKARGK